MTTIDDYVLVAFCRLTLKQDEVAQSFQTRFELETVLRNLVVKSLKIYPAAAIYDASAVASYLFDRLAEASVIETTEDPLAGTYHRLKFVHLQNWRNTYLSSSEIAARATLVGSRFLRDAFENYFSGKLENLSFEDSGGGVGPIEVPASDRIVTLGHNQQVDLDEASTELIEAVETENAIDGDISLTQRIVGQLRAGRELVRAQTFRAYLLYSSIVTVLGGLIEKYKGRAIGVAATKLLELLIEHVFKS